MKVHGFFGLGQEQSHLEESVFEADHPEVFAATDTGITPIEYLIVGLASCLTAGVASVAQNRGIQLRSVEATVEGAHDIRGILGADSDVRNGFNDIKVTFTHRCGRVAGGHRGAGGPVPEALRCFRRSREPDERHRRSRLSESARSEPPVTSGRAIEHVTTVVIGAGHAGLAASQLPARPVDRSRRAGARRGGELLAARALGLPRLSPPIGSAACRAWATTARTPTGI